MKTVYSTYMSIVQTKHGTWQVRWRQDGHHRSKTLRTRARAEKFERQVRAREEVPDVPTIYEPLWRKVLRSQLDDRAAIEVDGFNPNGFFVYMLWDRSEDQPIYIGASRNILARLGNHLVNPDRRHRVSRITLVRCWSRAAMATTEARLIDFYRPELNLLDGNGRRIRKDLKVDASVVPDVEGSFGNEPDDGGEQGFSTAS